MVERMRGGWVLAICLYASAALGNETGAAGVVRAFYAHLSGGGVTRAGELWTGEGRPQLERRYGRIAAVRCMRVVALDISPSADDGVAAAVGAVATIAEWHAQAVSERLARRHSRFRLVREGGAWRIAEWIEKEPQLAEAIVRATTDAQREALLRDNESLVGVELGEALTKAVLKAVNEPRLADAAAVIAIARRIAEDHPDPRLLSKIAGIESVLARHYEPPDPATSIAMGEESVRLAELSGDPDALLQALIRLIRALRAQTPSQEIPWLGRLLDLTDRVEDLSTAALAATNAAWYYDDRRQHRDAFVYSLRAQKLAEATGDLTARVNAQMNLGGAYAYKNDYALSFAHYSRALALAREAGFRATEASILERLAFVRLSTEDPVTALPFIEEILKIADELQSAELRGEALLLRGWQFMQTNRLEVADGDLECAMFAARESEDPLLIYRAEKTIEMLRFYQGRHEEVLTTADHHGVRAVSLFALGLYDEAEVNFRIAIEAHEQTRPDVGVDPRQIRQYMSALTPMWNALTDLLLIRDRRAEAIELLDRRKASVLRDVLAQTGIGPSTLRVDERKKLEELERTLETLNRAIDSRSPATLRAERDLARLEVSAFWSGIYGTHPELRWSSVPASHVEELAAEGVLYVSYAVMGKKTVVFTVSREKRRAVVRVVEIPIAQPELRKRVRQFVRQIETRDLGFAASARALYDLLLRPIESELFRAGRRVCIIPDDELWRLPFHALKPSAASFVAEKVSVFYAPSISVVNTLRGRDARRSRDVPRLLAFGNPTASRAAQPLPEAVAEVRAIARLYPQETGRVQLHGSADEGTFKSAAPAYDVVHIASHAQLDDSPMYSAVLLGDTPSEDGRLEARELASMKLGARLVVISACESARGDHRTAEGVVGLPWALLATGARSSVVSLWPVDSKATAELMLEMHRRLLANDLSSVSDALRGAQRALLRNEEYSHPYYWAPFVAVGAD